MADTPLPPACDLPPDIMSLARMIVRECRAPGQYAINLTVSPYRSEPLQVEILTVSTVRTAELTRRDDA